MLSDKEKKASSYERNEEIQAIRRKYTPGEEKETFKKEKKNKTMKIKFVTGTEFYKRGKELLEDKMKK